MKKKRMSVNARKDKKMFAKTAAKTKRVNVRPGEWRGGIML